MNYSQRATLRVTGVLLFAMALIFNIFAMPHAQDIRMADEICNAKFDIMGYGVEVGQFAQKALDYEKGCNKMYFMRLGVDYSWIVLVVGVVLFFIGVWAGLGAKGKKEMLG